MFHVKRSSILLKERIGGIWIFLLSIFFSFLFFRERKENEKKAKQYVPPDFLLLLFFLERKVTYL